MKTLKEIADEIEIWDGWRDQYGDFVPAFIEESKTGKHWKDWDADTFWEYFEKSNNQCVSSLKQGYFSGEEKKAIKINWFEIAPLLQTIALSQDEPLFEVYDELKKTIRKYTKQNRRASTNRLIAGLQPNLLCTIVNEDNIKVFIKKLNENVENCNIPITGDWFKNSNAVWRFFSENLKSSSIYENITLPWQIYEYLINDENKTNDMSEIPEYRESIIKLLQYKKQIILQGPPGTGKTREAKLISESILKFDEKELQNSEQFKIIQFHPSYTYEDFVRGIVAEPNGDKVEYKNINKTLGEFADMALKNYLDAKKKPEQISRENWINKQYDKFKESIQTKIDTDNEVVIKENTKPKITFVEDDSLRVNRYSNENDSILVKDSDVIIGYIGLYLSETPSKVRENELLSKSARSGMYYLYQNLVEMFKKYLNENNLQYSIADETKAIEKKPFILIIDEINRANLSSVLGELIYALEYRGEEIESMYSVDNSLLKNKLILPPNLYIIGTMNTADRSVGHIDYAIRRRFAFVDVLPKNLKKEDGLENFDETLFAQVKSLFTKDEYQTNSDYLTDEFKPAQVALGQSYFIDKTEDGGSMDIRLEYEIKPILREYVKDGILKSTALDTIENLGK